MAVVRHLGFVVPVFGTPRVYSGHCANYGWNRCSVFDNMQVLIFCVLDFRMRIYAPKMGGVRKEKSKTQEYGDC